MWGFGAWGYANIITSDYNPTSPDFPKAIVDLAIDKEDGYLSQNGIERQANWVEKDFALGFRVRGGRTAKASPAASTSTTGSNAVPG